MKKCHIFRSFRSYAQREARPSGRNWKLSSRINNASIPRIITLPWVWVGVFLPQLPELSYPLWFSSPSVLLSTTRHSNSPLPLVRPYGDSLCDSYKGVETWSRRTLSWVGPFWGTGGTGILNSSDSGWESWEIPCLKSLILWAERTRGRRVVASN